MIKKPNIKSQDKETNRSILKSNSPRQICSSNPPTKVGNCPGSGMFKRPSLLEGRIATEEFPNYIRGTRSDSITQNKDHKSIIRRKSTEKQRKKVQFDDSPTVSGDENVQQNPFQRLIECDKAEDFSNIHNLLKSVNDSHLAQIIDDKADNLLTILSAMPTSETSQEDQQFFFRTNINLLSKMSSIERVAVTILIVLFFIMIFKHFRYDWLSSSTSVPHLTGSDILMLMGKNIKRIWKNLVLPQSYFG